MHEKNQSANGFFNKTDLVNKTLKIIDREIKKLPPEFPQFKDLILKLNIAQAKSLSDSKKAKDALFICATYGLEELTKLLLAKKASILTTTDLTLFYTGALSKDVMEKAIIKNPLYAAVVAKNDFILELLLQNNIELFETDTEKKIAINFLKKLSRKTDSSKCCETIGKYQEILRSFINDSCSPR